MLLQLTLKLQIVFLHEFWAATDAELQRTVGPKLRTGDSFHVIDVSSIGYAAVGSPKACPADACSPGGGHTPELLPTSCCMRVLEQLQPTFRPLGWR